MSIGPDLQTAGSDPAASPYAIPPHEDHRARARRILGPSATAVVAVALLGLLAVVDPNEPGHYPVCPTQALLGIDCPGCGLMRGTHALVTGDVPGALDHNILLVVLVPLVVVLWVRWGARAWRGRMPGLTHRALRWRTILTVAAFVALIAFGVVRNLVPYLGSGIG